MLFLDSLSKKNFLKENENEILLKEAAFLPKQFTQNYKLKEYIGKVIFFFHKFDRQ